MMNRPHREHPRPDFLRRLTFAWVFLALYAASAPAQMSQTFTLEPGWNSIYLEIKPDDAEIRSIFDNVEIESVWRYLALDGVTGLPSNPADGLAGIAGWRVYFQTESPDSQLADLSDLFTLRANNAYLIKFNGSQPAVITITGKPVMQKRRWSADAYTLTGLNVDPALSPSFETYFAASEAHASSPVYELGTDGIWRLVDPTAPIRHGRAYWIFTVGASSFQGPLEVLLSPGFSELDFGIAAIGADLIPVNRAASSQEISLTRLPAQPAVPLYFLDGELFGEDRQYRPLEDAFATTTSTLTLAPGASARIQVVPRRADMTVGRLEQVLVLTSTDGARVLVPTALEVPEPSLAARAARATQPNNTSPLDVGLWSGFAILDEVDFAEAFSGGTPQRTGQPFGLRIILHVDANLQPTLISSVVQLFEPGKSDQNNNVCRDGRPVLITRRERFGDYEGLVLKDQDFIGARLSTTAYDLGQFDDNGVIRQRNDLPMVPDPADSNRYFLSITHASNSPSNPFYHPFHPDLDNLDPDGLPAATPEVPQIDRTLALQFCPGSELADICSTSQTPDPGNRLAGTFTDELRIGTDFRPVTSRGTFELQKVTSDPELNPAPLDDCP